MSALIQKPLSVHNNTVLIYVCTKQHIEEKTVITHNYHFTITLYVCKVIKCKHYFKNMQVLLQSQSQKHATFTQHIQSLLRETIFSFQKVQPAMRAISSSCGGLWPLTEAFFLPLGKLRDFCAVFAYFGPFLVFGSNLSNFEQ